MYLVHALVGVLDVFVVWYGVWYGVFVTFGTFKVYTFGIFIAKY